MRFDERGLGGDVALQGAAGALDVRGVVDERVEAAAGREQARAHEPVVGAARGR